MLRYLTRDRIALLAALAAPLAAATVLLPFRASWSNTNAAMLLVVVVGVAAIGNRVAGALAAVWAAGCFDFFFTLPYHRLTISSSASATTAVLLLFTGLAVSQLAARARRLQVIAITDEGYLAQIRETASLAATARRSDRPRPGAAHRAAGPGRMPLRIRVPARPPAAAGARRHHRGRPRWCHVEQQGLPAEEIELRVFGNGQYYGRFMLRARPGSRPALQARLVAVTLADQAGRALGASPPGPTLP